jgi:hypothetical protein
VYFLEPLWNRDSLGANFHALQALDTLIGTLLFLESNGASITEPCHSWSIVYHCLIVQLEYTWYFHIVGARHAIATIGAGNGTEIKISFSYLIY